MKEANATQEYTKQPLEVEPAKLEDAAEVFDVQRRTWLDTYPNEAAGVTYEDLKARLEGVTANSYRKK